MVRDHDLIKKGLRLQRFDSGDVTHYVRDHDLIKKGLRRILDLHLI